MESKFSRCASVSASPPGSLTLQILKAGLSLATLKTSLPIRPRPFIPSLIILCLADCVSWVCDYKCTLLQKNDWSKKVVLRQRSNTERRLQEIIFPVAVSAGLSRGWWFEMLIRLTRVNFESKIMQPAVSRVAQVLAKRNSISLLMSRTVKGVFGVIFLIKLFRFGITSQYRLSLIHI